MKKRNFWVFLGLSFVTLGIYSLVFWYSMSKDINKLESNSCKPLPNYVIVVLLSFLTFGIYGLVWTYQIGETTQTIANTDYGLNLRYGGTFVVLCTLLGLFSTGIGFLIADYVLIDNFNKIADAYNR